MTTPFWARNSSNGAHTSLPYFRQLGAISNDLSNWAMADGANGWDQNDPHGVYFSGTTPTNGTISGSNGTITTDIHDTPRLSRDAAPKRSCRISEEFDVCRVAGIHGEPRVSHLSGSTAQPSTALYTLDRPGGVLSSFGLY